jgi:hypothetical protein
VRGRGRGRGGVDMKGCSVGGSVSLAAEGVRGGG